MELKDSILEKTIEIVWFVAMDKSEQERSGSLVLLNRVSTQIGSYMFL